VKLYYNAYAYFIKLDRNRVFPPFLHSEIFKITRKIRDPLYNYVYITDLEGKIIDTPEFQRLDRLYQNPIVRYIYPNGTHTRKSHSLGVMHLYHKALLMILYNQSEEFQTKIHSLYTYPTVRKNSNFIDNLDNFSDSWWNSKTLIELIQIGRISALLHDIGHGPFSHLFEEACNEIGKTNTDFRFKHEEATIEIIEVKLDKYFKSQIKIDDVLRILDKKKESNFMREIIDGPYDVDKLDYINRDSYHCGTTEFGNVDYDRILDGFRIKGEKLFISESSLSALMNSFNSLQLIYTYIYFHKTCRIFDHMIIDALRLIPDFVKETASNINRLLDADDMAFLMDIKHKRNEPNFQRSWDILKDVLNRNKRYSAIATYNITAGMATEIKDELLNLKQRFEDENRDLNLIFDFTDPIKGLRINSAKIFNWLLNPQIISVNDDSYSLKNLKEISESYYNTLKQYQIWIYVFIDRKKAKNNNYESRAAQIKFDIHQEIDSIEQKKKLQL